MAKLSEKSALVLNYVREHDEGDGLTMQEVADGVGLTVKQISPIVWTVLGKESKDGRPKLTQYKKINVEGEEKPVGYVFITEDGINYTEED